MTPCGHGRPDWHICPHCNGVNASGGQYFIETPIGFREVPKRLPLARVVEGLPMLTRYQRPELLALWIDVLQAKREAR